MMVKLNQLIYSVIVASMFACSTPPTAQPEPALTSNRIFNDCKIPRPEICTQEFKPVCATRDTGIRCITAPCPSSELKTYGNACSACADSAVMGFTEAACEAK